MHAVLRSRSTENRARVVLWVGQTGLQRLVQLGGHGLQLSTVTVVDPGRPATALQGGSAASSPEPTRVTRGAESALGSWEDQLGGLAAP